MPQQINSTIQSNGHQPLDSDLKQLENNFHNNFHNSPTSSPPVVEKSAQSADDWSFATKELLDALPQRWTRGLLYLLIAFVTIALPWGMLSKVDETGTARGRLEPQGGTLKQELNLTFTAANVYTQTAKVEKVHVQEGDKIEAGDVLIELESRPIRDRLEQLNIQLQSQENRLSKLQEQKNQLAIELRTQQRQNQSRVLEKLAQVEQARQNLQSLKTIYNLQKEEKLTQVNQAQQNLAALKRTLNLQKEEKLTQVHQATQQLENSKTAHQLAQIRWQKALREVERYGNLLEQGVVTEIQVVQQEDRAEERQRIFEQTQADIEQAKLRIEEQTDSYQRIIHQAEADIQQAQLRLTEQQSNYQRIIHQAEADIQQAQLSFAEQENNYQTITHSGEIALSKIQEQLKTIDSQIITMQAEISQTSQEINSLNFELEQRVVKAQQSGTIFTLPIEGVGDVLQQGEMVVEIAPKETNLLLKAAMATTESGSLQEGMAVKMKFDAYPFQDYGIVEGTLKEISPTSQVQQTPEGNISIYELEIELNQTCIPTAQDCLVLRPGDTATAEVVVRQRRLIDFILDPFKKLQKGGLEL